MKSLGRAVTLHLPNEIWVLPPLQAFVAEAAHFRGFSKKDLQEIEIVLEEAVSNVLHHAYQEGEEATFQILLENTPLGIALTVRDQGIPYTPEAIPSYNAPRNLDEADLHGLGLFLMRHLTEELSFHNLGPQGKEVRFAKYLPTASVAEDLLLGKKTRPMGTPVEIYQGPLDYTIRPLDPSEAVEISRCAYEAYRYSYPNSHIYYPERVVELNKTGDIVSLVAASEEDLLGHCALEIPQGSENVEIGMAFVKPRYRGRGLLKEMTLQIIQEARRRGYTGVFVQSVTTHEASQKGALSLGFRHSALLPGFFAPAMEFRNIARAREERLTLAHQYLPLKKPEERKIYPPQRHGDFLQKIYASLEIPRIFADPPPEPASSSENTEDPGEVTATYMEHINATVIDVSRAAGGTPNHLHHMVRQFCLRRIDAVLLKLNLEDPLAPKIAGDLEKRGFLFCGVFPAFQEDRLALIYLNNCIVNFEEIHVADPMGEALVAYIQHLGKEREEEEA
jgi:serine/threonine-protein kinase RsbW